MSTTPSPEIWNNILKDNHDVEKDDPFWKEYLDKAAVFDTRMVDEWNKIVDVLLVYGALFIATLTSFIATTFPQFQRNPADITNDLLVAIYKQQVAQSNNSSIPSVDPTSYFNLSQVDYDVAVTLNALLYISLSLSIIVSVIALAAKLWLVNYSHQVFSVGSSYDRARKRQEAYNGVLVWKMGEVINMLPVILLIALYLFGCYVYMSVSGGQDGIGVAVGALLSAGLLFLGFTSLVAAFVPGCPFRSGFSGVIRLIFEKLPTIILSKRILCGCLSPSKSKWLWKGTLAFLWFVSIVAAAFFHPFIPGTWFSFLSLVVTIPIAYSLQQEAVHKPQKYKISSLAALMFLFASMTMVVSIYFSNSIRPTFIFLYIIGMSGIFSAFWMISKVSKSMADTGEIDAIAWLLLETPQYPAKFFKKAGQMIGVDSIGRHYRPRLLESLMPLLTPLIISYHAPEPHCSDTQSPQSDDVLNRRLGTHLSPVDDMVPIDEDLHLRNLEIYIACLARLSDFTDYKGTFWCLREDAKQHPKLGQPLIDKLVEFANPQRHSQVVRSAATKVLNNYKLNMEGKPLRSSTIALESVATVPRNAAASTLDDNRLNSQEQGHPELDPFTHVEPSTPVEPAIQVEPATPVLEPAMHLELAHSSEEIEVVKSGIRDEEIELVRREIGFRESGIEEEGDEDGMVKKNDFDVVNRKAQEGVGRIKLLADSLGIEIERGEEEKGLKMDVDAEYSTTSTS